MNIVVHWFRCDLRLSDNTALHAAVTAADVVVPVFIFDPRILQSADVSSAQVAFMIECLRSLEKNIEVAGGKLIFRHGSVLEEMRVVLRETGARALFTTATMNLTRGSVMQRWSSLSDLSMWRFTATRTM